MELELADDLPALLTLERVDRDLFRARNANLGPRQTLYGGQVAAQGLMAAAATIEQEDRLPHSFHGYFLRPGRTDLPVVLRVERDRDGRSFSARHVVAVQEGEVIFSMLTSFHAESESGVYDGAPMRATPAPEDTPRGGRMALLEVREVTPTDFLRGVFSDCVWARSSAPLGDSPLLHRARLGPTCRISGRASGSAWHDQHAGRAEHRPCHVVPTGHPSRRVGADRPRTDQGLGSAQGVCRYLRDHERRTSGRRSTRSTCSGRERWRPRPREVRQAMSELQSFEDRVERVRW